MEKEETVYAGNIPVSVIRSNRKSTAIQMTRDGWISVRVPLRFPRKEIRKLVEKHADWIRIQLEKQKEMEKCVPTLTNREIQELVWQARVYFPKITEYYAEKIGVPYGKISIRKQRTVWGSCNGKGDLSFNCALMLAPPEVRDYVIIHEICHRRHMNHSPAFWREVEKAMPGYRKYRKWLKKYETELILQVHGKKERAGD